ncbi:MAG: hypothetical protein U0R49_12490 [Fimbriimonadales bacterium]
MRIVKAGLVGFGCAASAFSVACAWDRDTLEYEHSLSGDAAFIIAGRFDKNPPLYYQMRLNRVAGELKRDPTKLALYDDAGVAADKLGKSDIAIEWMHKKGSQLKLQKASSDDWYRYHANLGTFYAHKWFRDGAKHQEIALLNKAIAELREALRINPEAHFGRELVQVATIEMVRTGKQYLTKNASPDEYEFTGVLSESFERALGPDYPTEKTWKGLLGLVAIGNAWESVDVFVLISHFLSRGRLSTIAKLASFRVEELEASGARSLFGSDTMARAFGEGWRIERGSEGKLRRAYDEMRNAAIAYDKARDEYMIPLLNQGKHPDTDPNFWAGFSPPTMPNIDLYDPEPAAQRLMERPWLIATVVVMEIAAVLFVIRYLRKRATMQ